MFDHNTDQKIPLIIGSTGKTGSRVAKRFRKAGLEFREASRTSQIPFDWYDPTTWPHAFQGIRSIYVVFYPDLAVPGAAEIIADFIQTAISSGVGHLVLLTGRGEKEAQKCERMVMESAIDWTIIRSGWFAQNFSESFLLDEILRGQVTIPSGEIPEPFVDIEDIADIAFAAMTDEKHRGQLYEITGPDLLTFRQAIELIASAVNRKIDFRQVSMDEYGTLLAGADVPADFIALLKYLFSEVLDGRNAHLNDGVKQALGREPANFTAYVEKTATSGIWSPVNQEK